MMRRKTTIQGAQKRLELLGKFCISIITNAFFDRFVFEGYVDGLTHMDRLLSFYTYENAVSKAHFLVHERLSILNHIEAVFIAASDPTNGPTQVC